MKRLAVLLSFLILSLLLISCIEEPENTSSSVVSEYSAESEASLFTESEAESKEAESKEASVSPEELFDFTASKYTVVSRRSSFDTEYTCEYYFVNGTVGGMKLLTTLKDADSAKEYFEHIKEDGEYAELNGNTVITYIDDEDAFCFGYTLEKLLFVLEKGSYDFELKFDEKDFYEDFPEESKA